MHAKEFEFFLQVCHYGSIRRAAKSLYISPQGLGKAIKNLERDLGGIKLFERGKDGIHLTEYGAAIKPFAQNIIDNVYAINCSIGQLNKQISGTLNVACSLGVVGAMNPSVFEDFQTLYPEVNLNIIEATDLKVQEMVAKSDDIIGISVGPIRTLGLAEKFLTSNKLVWLINKKNPLSTKDVICFADIKDEPLVMYTEDFMVYQNVLACCRREGFAPSIAYFINEAIMAYKFCKKYNAIAITVDFIAEDVATDEIVIKPILDEACKWDLYVINRADVKPSKIQQSFINCLLGLA